MPRPLKVFATHIGFHDLIVAAPSMKAAAEAFGARVRIFAEGLAKRIEDGEAVRAALAQPGVVLKRPHGGKGPFKKEPDPIPMPRVSAARKKAIQRAAQKRKRGAADRKKAQEEGRRKAAQEAKAALAELDRAEAQLRLRRQALTRKLRGET